MAHASDLVQLAADALHRSNAYPQRRAILRRPRLFFFL